MINVKYCDKICKTINRNCCELMFLFYFILKNIGSNGVVMLSRNVLVFINSKIIIKNSHIING